MTNMAAAASCAGTYLPGGGPGARQSQSLRGGGGGGWGSSPGCPGTLARTWFRAAAIRNRLLRLRDKDGQAVCGHERFSAPPRLRLGRQPWGWVDPRPGCCACPQPWCMAPWPSSSLFCTTCFCFTMWTPLSRCTRSAKLPSGSESLCGEELLVGGEEVGSITLGQYLRQLARHRNFLWFVGMDLVQVFHCHFNSNFFPLFLEQLLSDRISLSTGSFLLGVSYVAPHLNNLYFLPLCRRWGVYTVVRGLFLLKLGLSLLMLLAGPDRPGLLCLFIASNRVFTEGTCKLLTLVVTDLVDEDLVLNHRKQAASALLFGMVALVTKPGQTFAPLLGTWLLCFYTGHDLFQQPPLIPVGSAQPWPEPPAPPPAQAPTLRQGCFYLLVLVPITCALLQLFTWSKFTLHGRHLHMVKAQRQNLSQAQTLDIKTV
ncbi:transmembrane protein 180 isoform X3 [Phyllostomus discolor]|uniref:Transmembrane protein 180 isoform X3 n=1 Tax=Phyllostomus discolor TaxID=89673 RepID=A0A7E6DW51_9CHIR|nr:transmembrane protein 180 isoform X3 [Phyllostomus discolor]